MEQEPTIRLACSSIPYRKGFIEVTPNIHAGHVNIESWGLKPEVLLEGDCWITDSQLSDSDVCGFIELELTADQAKDLADALIDAIARLSR